jgi:hypothetical protein
LIRDNHHKADKAHAFLEHRTKTANVYGIANLRDVLSHLATFLGDGLSPEKRRDQLANAEEHLRRAIIEPYETAINSRTVDFVDLYDKYRRFVIPARDRYDALRKAPDTDRIEATLEQIRYLTENGKTSKLRNILDPHWEEGVICFVDGFKKLDDLTLEIEDFYFKWMRLKSDRRTLVLSILSIVLTFIIGALGIWVSVLVSKSP